MLRRLLEASTRAAAGQPVSSLPGTASPTPALPTNPSASLTGPATASSSSSPGSSGPPQHNSSTIYLPENDELEYSILAAFSDMETVFLACISTLLPLIFALGIAFGIRHVWRKYRERRSSTANGLPWYRGVCSRDDTAESLHQRPHNGSQTIQPPTQILSAQDLVNGMDGPRYICETEVMEQVALRAGNTAADYASPGSHASKNANGNIITLTLKNNHLIVETEERAFTMEDKISRKFQDNGCSVIVEVPPDYQSDEIDVNRGSSDDMTGRVTDQQALVHREEIPEDRSSAFDNAKLFGSTNTGLSQSDLSICSQGSANPSYRYGNQLEYEAGHFGYPMYGAGCDQTTETSVSTAIACKLDGDANSKWVEFDKSPDTKKTLLEDSKTPSLEKDVSGNVSTLERYNNNKQSSQDSGSSLEQQDSTDLSNSADTTTVRSNPNLQMNGATPNKLEVMEQKILNIDLMIKSNETNSTSATTITTTTTTTKPVITGAILKDEASLQEDTFQEQQRKLGNGTLTPEHHRANTDENIDVSNRSELINKEQNNVVTRPEGSTFVPTHKRTGSIPPRLIEESLEIERKKALDIYSQIKTSTKNILPGLSPKFELLQNEVSPVDDKES